jgi:hypothetical protein
MSSTRLKMWSILSLGIMVVFAGCGGSSSDAPPPGATSISGSVYASSVSGASVVVKNAAGATIAGPVTTSANGTYTINVPTSAMGTDLRVESSGGTFTDESTGTSGVAAGAMSAYVSGGSATVVHLDPASTVIHALVSSHSKTFGEANALFTNTFGFTHDCSVGPVNGPYSASSTTAQRLAALRAAAFSKLTQDMGLSPDKQFDLLAAVSQDLADGDLDGMNDATVVSLGAGTMPVDVQNRFENALVSFLTNTAKNFTGLKPGDVGDWPFGKIAQTNTYTVEYVPGTMAASVGKTEFQIRITDRNTQLGVSGLTLKLMPMMHMSTKNHASPAEVKSDNGDGTYTCRVYYLMESGPMMGFWELKVMTGMGMGAETATFYPQVKKDMTALFKLYGNTDLIQSTPTSTERRVYLLFNDGLISGATSTFNIFLATKETMMNFPAVSIGTILSNTTGTWTVDGPPNTSLEASLDNTFPAPDTVIGIDNGGGHWSLPGLSTGATATIYVRLTVNSELKTGLTMTSPAYASFKVTP